MRRTCCEERWVGLEEVGVSIEGWGLPRQGRHDVDASLRRVKPCDTNVLRIHWAYHEVSCAQGVALYDLPHAIGVALGIEDAQAEVTPLELETLHRQ